MLITADVLQALQPGDVVRDTNTRGFYAECSRTGAVSLKVAADLERGKTVRKTIGKWPGIDLDQARLQALLVLTEVRAGRDPRATTRATPTTTLTVGAAVDRYLAYMTKTGCAPKTIEYTRGRLTTHLAAWLDRPLLEIKPSDCQGAHERLTSSNGPVVANKVLRDFRATWNLALRQSDAPESFPRRNPVGSVTFNVESRRENAVVADLASWWRRVSALDNELRACMHKLALLSGLRPGNVAGCKRAWLDLTPGAECIRFPASVMKSRVAFMCPLSPAMVHLVKRALELGATNTEWLFPTRSRDRRRWIATACWRERTLGSNECGHSLRHTYSTRARAAGIPASDVELLLHHAVPGVGGVYLHQDSPEMAARMRQCQLQITSAILKACGVGGE